MSEGTSIYIEEISRLFATGAATEHSYRPALQRLLSAAMPRAEVVNEPAHIECGAPDILVREKGSARRPIGYVETKCIGDGDLDGNSMHREQFDRYKAELANIVFTDYLDFHFYEDGQFVAKCRIGEVAGNRIVPVSSEEQERFAALLRHFADVTPKRITSPARLAQLMAGKARLLARAVAATLNADPGLESAIGAQMQAFRQWLVHDLDAESFADVYAQTIVYGMFAARLHDKTPEDFSRSEAAELVPRTNPLLRRLFRDLDEYVDESIVWIIDDLVALFAVSDVASIMRNYGRARTPDAPDVDPLLHFYEDFLAAYNPGLRKQRGVWYTPVPAVRYIIRSIDEILRCVFGLSAGLADASKTRVRVANDNRSRKGDAKFVEREMHRVQLLDPALGTGTFLAEAVRLIRSKFAGQEGLWPGYVRDHLIPRLNGFEILMASYAMAHLKIDMLLSVPDLPRLRIFLTNSLEEFSETTGTLWAMELSNESREADFIKRDCPVMVVLGNPPYSVSSSNKGEWIQRLVADYKEGLNEKKINLDDDYIKFIRLGQHYIDRNGEGILAYITNNSFLDGITHRRMRQSLMASFDEIHILDLHGNARKKETAPDGSKDENVFDIMQGVSINIFVKKKGNGERGTGNGCRVFHSEVFGTREAKYAFLDSHDMATAGYKEIHPVAPYYFFVPKDFALEDEYNKGFSVAELMPIRNNGIKTDRDLLFVDDNKVALEYRIQTLLGGKFRDDFTDKYRVVDSGSYRLTERIRGKFFSPDFILREAFRPFDEKWIYYDPTLVSRPAQSVMKHMKQPNICLSVSRQCQSDWRYTFCAEGLSDVNLIASAGLLGSGYVFPLYLYQENMGKVERVPNLNPEIVKKMTSAISGNPAEGLVESGTVLRFLEGSPVATLTGHEFEGMSRREIVSSVYKEWERVGYHVTHPEIGQVELSKSGIHDSMAHGIGRRKIAAFHAIPEIIAKGLVVRYRENWEGRGYDSYVVVAPISIGGVPCLALVVVNKSKNGSRFYLHEVGPLEEAKKCAEVLRTGSSDESSALSRNLGDMKRIAYPLFAVNGGLEEKQKKLCEQKLLSPESIFHYIYAVLHTPSYRERYKEFLKVDFPRIPYPKSAEEFNRLAAIGERLVAVHLLKAPEVRDMFSPYANFPVSGDNRVESVKYEGAKSVRINATQYFDNVPSGAWEFYIGGYQPAQKWLKDRKGRVLSPDDLMHYKAIIAALVETRRLMEELETLA